MEGTSGAADLEPLRGGSGEAALDPAGLAKAGRPGSRELAARSFIRAGRARAARSSEAYRSSSLRRGGDGGRTAPDSPSGAPRSRDMRCPSGSGWGEALVSGHHFRVTRASCSAHVESRKARCERGARKARGAGERNAPRSLTRETSAGAGQEPSSGPQGSSEGERAGAT